MLKRILTSIIGLVVFFGVIFSHHYVLYSAVILLIMGMLYEVYGVMGIRKELKAVGFLSALIICAGFLFGRMIAAGVISCMLFLLMMIYLHGKSDSKEVLSAAFMTIFITVFMTMLILIRRRCDRYTVILPFICAWLTDTGAYFAGTFLGKHKLVPNISPKKTIEGAIGGILLSTIGSVLYIVIMVAVMAGGMASTEAVLKFAFIGFIGSFLAQAGDLIASCIKRDCGKKDYGSILPGHGGIMDRFDSVIFVTPFVYYAMIHLVL
ncbi:MAG: phosphatidate cytidylyltransferase [Clostridia bacterium]|nr:phosphatidate cytidylyltransferase [Clostridia bacterium]